MYISLVQMLLFSDVCSMASSSDVPQYKTETLDIKDFIIPAIEPDGTCESDVISLESDVISENECKLSVNLTSQDFSCQETPVLIEDVIDKLVDSIKADIEKSKLSNTPLNENIPELFFEDAKSFLERFSTCGGQGSGTQVNSQISQPSDCRNTPSQMCPEDYPPERPYICRNCGLSYKCRRNLREHIIIKHTLYRPFKCPDCHYATAKKSHFKTHRRVHTGERPYSCDECDGTFKYKANLNLHVMSKHTKEKPFKCQQCEYACVSKGALGVHLIVHSENLEKRYKCDMCDFATARHACYIQHAKVHTVGHPYTCQECDAAFKHERSLKDHTVSKHSLERPFKCSLCDFVTIKKRYLTIHARVHTGERPYPCTECSATFKHRTNLKSHVLVKHKNEKPHHCQQCDYRTAIKGNLSLHLKVHAKNSKSVWIISLPMNAISIRFNWIEAVNYLITSLLWLSCWVILLLFILWPNRGYGLYFNLYIMCC